MNSMESYLIDINIFEKICSMYKIKDSEFEQFKSSFNQYINNFMDFNICFITQVRNITYFQTNTLSFDDIPYCEPFIDKDNSFIFNIDSFKNKVQQDKEQWYNNYITLKENFEEIKNSCSESNEILKFLHGKYLLKYIIFILKTIYNKLKTLNEDTIINHFKDNFIISCKYNNFDMFQKIEYFATV